MLWRKVDGYHATSDCGNYRISRSKHGDRWIYQAWGPRGPDRHPNLLGTYSDRQQAMDACTKHADPARKIIPRVKSKR